jgi:HEPN domain-containing protein
VTWKAFARVLVRKSERALKSARRNLTDGDYDSAVKPKIASEVVEKAESSLATEYESDNSNHDDKVSETDGASKIEKTDVRLQPISLEEIRREARENWLRSRQLKIEGVKSVGHGKDTDRDVKDDQSRSLDGDIDE